MTKAKDPIRELIESGRWKPIEEAPRDETIIIRNGDGFHCAVWVQNFFNGDEAWAIAELPDGRGGFDRVIVRNPNAWLPLPDNRLSDALEVAVETLEKVCKHEIFTAGRIGKNGAIHCMAEEALAKIKSIAEIKNDQ